MSVPTSVVINTLNCQRQSLTYKRKLAPIQLCKILTFILPAALIFLPTNVTAQSIIPDSSTNTNIANKSKRLDSLSVSPKIAINVTQTPNLPTTPPPASIPKKPEPEQSPLPAFSLTGELPPFKIDLIVGQIEYNFTQQFKQYIGQSSATPLKTLDETREILNQAEKATGIKPAIIYVAFLPPTLGSSATRQPQDSDSEALLQEERLELVVVTAKGAPIRKRLPATRKQVLKVAQEYLQQVTDITSSQGYLAPSQQLYQWLIAPLEGDLQARKIQNLTFIMDKGLRSLPIAALHDGKSFLIERYSIGLMPSLTLTNTGYKDIKDAKILAMGSDTFADQKPLPAVPTEIQTISQTWQSKSFLNNAFTLENLKQARQQQPSGIIHLATHSEFKSGKPANSYIQLWDSKLRLNQLRQMGWNKPPVELLVLSAGNTALGDPQAELGFAGIGVLAGVKSTLASLWYGSDQGTLALMTDFYTELKSAPIKAEALRQSQLAMIRGQVLIKDGKLITPKTEISLPSELVLPNQTLQHPYYWAAFTMIGNPW